MDELSAKIQAILFVAGEPVAISDLAHALNLTETEMNAAMDTMRDQMDASGGLRLNRFGGKAQLSIKPEYAGAVEALLNPTQRMPLTSAVMETLSIIAYRQPVTKSEIEAVRGVKCDYSVQSLLNKGLICEMGRRETLGRPVLYGTTDSFLRHFGIEDISQLPDINPEVKE
ncbi:MAG: SMC-Scp complex subunit ScpB [Clostridiales bacterium]|nr:SMC-Scp complex subunit ScpB [Clostridiales bacterium]